MRPIQICVPRNPFQRKCNDRSIEVARRGALNGGIVQ